MRFYIITGERSGDLHGSNLVKYLSARNELAEFRGVGGKRMQKEDVVIACRSSELAFMGFWQVARNIGKIWRAFRFIKKDISRYRPDAIILIDFPGFNMRIADWAVRNDIRVIYYITPQVWAWKPERIYRLTHTAEKLITILPFEQAYFEEKGILVDRVDHPVVEEVREEKARPADPKTAAISDKPIVALLPGSRVQEVRAHLPVMTSIARYFPDHQFVVAGVSEVGWEVYERAVSSDLVKVVYDKTYDVLKLAEAALVSSGTATLETALFGVPQVVCYKSDQLSFWVARKLVSIDHISLVNLVLERPVVRELIQQNMNETNLKDELPRILPGGRDRDRILQGYGELESLLGSGSGSRQAAEIIFEYMKE